MTILNTTKAAQLTGSSQSTIKRWARRMIDKDSNARSAIKQEPTPSGFKYSIDSGYLLSNFSKDKPKDLVKTISESSPNYNEEKSMEYLREQLKEKNILLEQKDRLISQQNLLIETLVSKLK